MPIEALPIDDDQHPWSLTFDKGSWTGQRWYRVNSGKIEEVAFATGVPLYNSPWSTSGPLSNLLVVRQGPISVWSHKAGATDDTRGWSYIPVDYEEPAAANGAGSMTPPPGSGIAYTIYRRSLTTTTVQRGLAFDGNDPDPTALPPGLGLSVEADEDGLRRIAQGDGMPVQLGTVQAEVHLFSPLTNPFDEDALDVFFAPELAVNADSITLPPVYPSNRTRTFTKGQLLLLGYDLSFEKNLWHLVLQFERATNHFFPWANVNKNGVPEGEKVIISKRYRNAPMAGILS